MIVDPLNKVLLSWSNYIDYISGVGFVRNSSNNFNAIKLNELSRSDDSQNDPEFNSRKSLDEIFHKKNSFEFENTLQNALKNRIINKTEDNSQGSFDFEPSGFYFNLTENDVASFSRFQNNVQNNKLYKSYIQSSVNYLGELVDLKM